LQHATRSGQYDIYREYTKLVNDQSRKLGTLRGLLDFKPGTPVPLDEVESVDSIVTRFATGAMSYGSISQEAHETLAIAMNRIRGQEKTREGGEARERRQVDPRGGRRGSGPPGPRRERRLAPERDQAGGVGPLRRHERIP